ncbi:MAG: YceI family protein [Spongiibacteraceae bacterium]
MTTKLPLGKFQRALCGGVFAVGMLLTACQPATKPQEDASVATPTHKHAHATRYAIDPINSSITLRVYRDGPLARFGHNHTIAITQIQGVVYREADLAQSEVELSFPVAEMIIDSPDDRAKAGPDFPGVISAEAIAGTRANMLGPQLLAAAQYPTIALRTVSVSGQWPELKLIVEISLRKFTSQIVLPVHISETNDSLIADGEIALSQVQLGLTPYSVLGGGLRVSDNIDARFHLVSVKETTVKESTAKNAAAKER